MDETGSRVGTDENVESSRLWTVRAVRGALRIRLVLRVGPLLRVERFEMARALFGDDRDAPEGRSDADGREKQNQHEGDENPRHIDGARLAIKAA
ncbi:hypothetical protein [Paramicrobacterium humi]|uniref:hypothetical protein n=1 Tax=Paramicrobacterium humi TaxID=640635 RepID=UPI00115FD857|nr:hypothetical protein [Microbacterium humi]